jgi:hypothetical protein
MELPNISAWNAGAEHDEDMFNAVSYAINFLLAPPECRVNQTSAQSIANNTTTATAISFNSASIDNDGMWNSGTPTYITIQTPGWYECEFAIAFPTHAGETLVRGYGLYLNGNLTYGSGTYAYNEFINDQSTNPQPVVTYDMFLNTGDQVMVGVIQGSGVSLSTVSSASIKDQQTFLRVRWASL